MNTNEIVLIDLSSIAYPVFKMSGDDPDPNAASTKIVARVRALASDHAHVAICCDAGRSFRADIAPTYKANRPERDEVLHHQIKLACERLKADGFPIWAVRGFEADDLIATATAKATEIGLSVIIASADKDLLQLVCETVRVKSIKDGTLVDAEAVAAKFGVRPDQIADYLCLVGDASDNVKGARGIGEKGAADLLAKHGSLDTIYRTMKTAPTSLGLTPARVTALREFEPSLETTRRLIHLRTDAEIPFDEIVKDRVPQDLPAPDGWAEEETMQADPEPQAPEPQPAAAPPPSEPATPTPAPPAAVEPTATPSGVTTMTRHEAPEVLAPAPSEWERQLDPRSLSDAKRLALDMFQSRLFSAYGTPQAVLSTVMVGRELGLPAMASLRGIHVVEGRHALSAALMVALVLKSGLAEYFEPLEFDDKHATFETKRKGARNPVKMTYTIEMAVTAGLVKDKSNWAKNPMAMCMARAQAMLCRLVYPDLLAGLYTPEELADLSESAAA